MLSTMIFCIPESLIGPLTVATCSIKNLEDLFINFIYKIFFNNISLNLRNILLNLIFIYKLTKLNKKINMIKLLINNLNILLPHFIVCLFNC